jgi:hypothetical protein
MFYNCRCWKGLLVFRGVNLLDGENGNCSFREKHIAYDEHLICPIFNDGYLMTKYRVQAHVH